MKNQRCKICGSFPKCGCEDPRYLLDPDHFAKGGNQWGAVRESRDEHLGNRKLAAILARLRLLWLRRTPGRRVSRLDGQTIFSDADWAALSESALFAKLREEEGGGGAPCQASPPSAAKRRGMPGVHSVERGGQ